MTLTKTRSQLFERLKRKKLARLGQKERIERRAASEAPLSLAQERLWFLEQFDPGNPRFNMVNAIRLKGELDRPALARSLTEVSRRHEILRTTFQETPTGPRQIIAAAGDSALPLIDMSRLPSPRRHSVTERLLIEQGRRPFDLKRGPLARWFLVRLAAVEHVLYLAMHQIIVDRWSRGLFVEEMAALYPSFVARRPSPLPAPELQYADFAAWQHSQAPDARHGDLIAYWRQQLRATQVFDWPQDYPRPALPSSRAAVHYSSVPAPVLEPLKAFSQTTGATLFMILTAALGAVAHRYTGHRDLVLGSPVAHRNNHQIEKVMGFFLNMLPLRLRIDPRQSFAQLVAQTQETALGAFSHQDLPFATLVHELVDGRDLSRHPLFQTTIVLQNAPLPPVELPGLELSLLPIDWGTTAFDLAFFFWETALWEDFGDGLSLIISYTTDLFTAATVRRLSRHLKALLRAAMDAPERPIGELCLLGRGERHQLLHAWSATSGESTTPLVPRLFETQTHARSAATAIVEGELRWTYADLDRAAGRLHSLLASRGVGVGTTVGVRLPRSAELVAVLLGILRSAAAYVPFSPDLPDERLLAASRHAKVALLIVHRSLDLDQPQDLPQVDLAEIRATIDSRQPIERNRTPSTKILDRQQTAAVFFTSGSSGLPKGVAIPHRAIASLMASGPLLTPPDRLGQLADPGFDAATFEIWTTLAAGARLVVLDTATALDAESFRRQRQLHGVTVQFLTTALFHQLAAQAPQAFDDLRVLLFGGETADLEHVRAVRHACPRLELWHAYGPTEATTFATLARLDAVPTGATVSLGRPLDGKRVYVLDDRLEPLPIGAIGEICLAGAGLASAYVDAPKATARAFVPDPFAECGGARLYRTGDLGRFDGRGELHFHGRRDQQIKVRGYRVELGDIEACLCSHAGVREAVVICQPAADRLVAHIETTPAGEIGPAQLRAFVRGRLPAYMTPTAFAMYEQLPRTSSGKIDRQTLTRNADKAQPAESRSPTSPRSSREARVAAIFCQVLGREHVGIDDDFFDLGGHSLAASGAVQLLRQSGLRPSLRQLFEHPTVAGLAAELAPQVHGLSTSFPERTTPTGDGHEPAR